MQRSSILEVGHATELLKTRSLVLRAAGYHVMEETDIQRAFALAQSDHIDLVLLCHSINRKEAFWLARVLRESRSLLPILCVVNNYSDDIPPGCWSSLAAPEELLATLEELFQQPATSRIFPGHRMSSKPAAKKNTQAT
jgi:CheY-like chemotaxis protein